MTKTRTKIDEALAAMSGPVTTDYTTTKQAYWDALRADSLAYEAMKKAFRSRAKIVKDHVRKRLGKRYPIVEYSEPGFSLDHSKKPVVRFPSVSFRMHLDRGGYGHRIAIHAEHCPKDQADLDRWLDDIIAMRDAYEVRCGKGEAHG